MFQQRRTRNMFEATAATLALIYHQTVYNIRSAHRNPIIGLLMEVVQASLFVVVFLTIFTLIGIKTSPVRGDFLLYIMSGIFVYLVHIKAVGAISGSHSISSALTKHEPLNAAVLIAGAALSCLYQQVFSLVVILVCYYIFFQPYTIHQPVPLFAMFGLSWACGCAVGLVLLGIRPWAPGAATTVSALYMRVNMMASGKMFLANAMPGFLLPWFSWNPLFHLIDQTRGFMFINYTPLRTSLIYPVYVCIAVFMVGLLINFATRKYESLSWGAAR
ncbi:ABC transporter [Paracoccus sp. 1_MG-2023]|uniref:ABC transporter permease n=1 Tax=unclassified Paracoccus (in: a-proteobacteria) TaxID=2688777 RepID=UPI001C088D05|nr:MULTISPECIES: ABC transporter [unclassified Paracoccus (in: a-proteobacteria)]MBU2957303.1 ABC transporter [Paracoccus sp. C2R09]MDO6669929.1 ABC transporter [Paracoccus sp. 1_MG-2023]